MKDFFLEILINLDKLTGLKQYEKLLACADWKKEVNDLLHILVGICELFPYIPEKDQQRIIRDSVISDLELTSLNAKIVYKWLSQHKDRYFKEVQHIPSVTPEDYQPVSDERRKEYLDKWLNIVNQFEDRKILPLPPDEVLKEGQVRPKREPYHPPGMDYYNERKAKLRELREKTYVERHPCATPEEVAEFLRSTEHIE